MTQIGLTDAMIKAVDLENDSKQHQTPATNPPMQKHEEASDFDETWRYRSLIGMLTYLARNTRLYIEYSLHQCARFQSNPKKPHANAIKRIVRYLLSTKHQGVSFKLNGEMDHFECFVDADVNGNYSQETSEDPNSVKSRTGCVIKYTGYPINSFSRLQTEIAPSNTEEEYMALSLAARETLSLRELLEELKDILQIPEAQLKITCALFGDNKGAEELAKVPRNRPRTKHIATKYHHFREHVRSGILFVKRVETMEQLADIFTKALARQPLSI